MAYLEASVWLPELIPPLPTVTGSSTPLNVGEVGTIIARVSGEIDSAAAQAGYAVPISTTATGYLAIQSIAEYGAGWKVLRRFMPNQGGPGGNIGLAGEYRDAYMTALAALRSGDLPIIGAALDTSGQGRELPRSYSTSNPGATAGVVPLVDLDYDY